MDVVEIHPRVFKINAPISQGVPPRKGGVVGLYLIKGERTALIDTGVYDSPETAIAPALAGQGLTLKDIDFVLNTHGHADHAGGNALFQSLSQAQFFISKRELPVSLGGDLASRARFFEPLKEIFGSQQFGAKLEDNALNSDERFRVDHLIGDKDTIDLGGSTILKVVALPGHTPGSVGYFWEREGILFAGDAIAGCGSRVGGLPIIFDPDAYGGSAAKLLEMPLRMLCCAHAYASFTLPGNQIRSGGDIKTFVQESAYVNEQIKLAATSAIQAEPNATLKRQGERLLEELPAEFMVSPLSEITATLWAAMGIFSFIWRARNLAKKNE